MAGTRLALPFSGAKLRALRQRQGLRQQDLSDKAAVVGREAISRYENGEAFPSVRSFGALVKALDCDPSELLDEPEAGAA
jgi:transcriptional regulator with XRE-family HTH domain